jgi:trimethylamine:corrinoid methyltransferase-like protein
VERIRFGLSGGLSSSQIEETHEVVLTVLERTGLACAHAATVEAATGTKGVRFEGGRLKFSRDLVEATIAGARKGGARQEPRSRVTVTAPWNCFNIIDMSTGAIRASTAADVVEMLKLVASFNESGPPPVYPCDLADPIQVLWLEKACLEATSGFGGEVITHDPEAIKWIGEMYAVAGKRYRLGMQFVISPLRLDHIALDVYWRHKDDPLVTPGLSLCPIPVGGMTAPLFTSGLLAQGIAESVGGLIVAQALGAAGPEQTLSVRVDYGDMRDMTVAYSLPENVMVQVLLRDLAEHFSGFRHDTIYPTTNAKRPDAFAAADRMAYMLMLGLAGYRNFILGAGQLSMDEVFSPAQFIIDMEMGRYVQCLLDGITWNGDPERTARTIAEGVSEGNFLIHPTTLEALPEFFDSLLFRRDNVGRWRSKGEPTLEEEALARARAAIEAYRFPLADETQAGLDEAFAKACRALGVDQASQPLPTKLPER